MDHETCVPPDKYGDDECVPAAAQKPNVTHGRDHHARAVREESSTSAQKSQAAQSFHISDQCHFGTSWGGQQGPGILQSLCQSFGPGTQATFQRMPFPGRNYSDQGGGQKLSQVQWLLHRQGGKVHQISMWPVQKIPLCVAMLCSVPHEWPHTCRCNQGTEWANGESGGAHAWCKPRETSGSTRPQCHCLTPFASMTAVWSYFAQVELKKCAFRSRWQFTIVWHNPANLWNRRMTVSIVCCIKGVPAVSASVTINVSNMLEVCVLSASARRCGLRLRIRCQNYCIHVTAERQCELCQHAHRAAHILRGLKFETLEDFAILWHLRRILEDMTPMSALFMHWRGKVSHLWCKEHTMWIQDTPTAAMSMKIWSSALSIKVGVWKHHLAEWNSISDAGAAPQAQLITERCRCNYHMLKATIVAVSTCSVKKYSARFWLASETFSSVGVFNAQISRFSMDALMFSGCWNCWRMLLWQQCNKTTHACHAPDASQKAEVISWIWAEKLRKAWSGLASGSGEGDSSTLGEVGWLALKWQIYGEWYETVYSSRTVSRIDEFWRFLHQMNYRQVVTPTRIHRFVTPWHRARPKGFAESKSTRPTCASTCMASTDHSHHWDNKSCTRGVQHAEGSGRGGRPGDRSPRCVRLLEAKRKATPQQTPTAPTCHGGARRDSGAAPIVLDPGWRAREPAVLPLDEWDQQEPLHRPRLVGLLCLDLHLLPVLFLFWMGSHSGHFLEFCSPTQLATSKKLCDFTGTIFVECEDPIFAGRQSWTDFCHFKKKVWQYNPDTSIALLQANHFSVLVVEFTSGIYWTREQREKPTKIP